MAQNYDTAIITSSTNNIKKVMVKDIGGAGYSMLFSVESATEGFIATLDAYNSSTKGVTHRFDYLTGIDRNGVN